MTAVRTLELFAGLGGMGLALPPGYEVVAAYDQDADAAATHELNHGVPVVRRDLASIGAGELARWEAEAWLLSPPCQPFTRRGRRRDVDDPRCRGFLRAVALLAACRPEHVLVENVVGFHGSRMHARLASALGAIGHDVASVRACPSEHGAPVRRPREFVVSSARGLRPLAEPRPIRLAVEEVLEPRADDRLRIPASLRSRVEDRLPGAGRGDVLGTFTRSYGRALTGAGPVHWDADGPRWFSPEEILELHAFPDTFRFPDRLGLRPRWKLAGNSVHVESVRRVAASWPAEPA